MLGEQALLVVAIPRFIQLILPLPPLKPSFNDGKSLPI
jgi:hypothetical protein